MSYSIADNYSVLNCYQYKNKSAALSALDWLSSPLRGVLGGRNVSVLSETYQKQMTTAKKISTVFFAVLIFPIAIISIACLLIKLATCPCVWEKKKIQVQSQQTWNIIHLFNNAFNAQNYDEAIRIYRTAPEIGERDDIDAMLFKTVNAKINAQAPWSELKELLQLLKPQDTIRLIDHAVKTRLDKENELATFVLSGQIVQNLITGSLPNATIETIEKCYKHLFANSLRISLSPHLTLTAMKLEIAHHLICALTQHKLQRAADVSDRGMANLQDSQLRMSLIEPSIEQAAFFNLVSVQNMNLMSQFTRTFQGAHRLSLESLNILDSSPVIKKARPLESQAAAQYEVTMGTAFNNLIKNIQTLSFTASAKEQEYMEELQTRLKEIHLRLKSQKPVEVLAASAQLNEYSAKYLNSLTEEGKNNTDPLSAIALTVCIQTGMTLSNAVDRLIKQFLLNEALALT